MLFAIFFIIFTGLIFQWLFSLFFDLSSDLHSLCLNLSPPSSYQSLYQAMVCGRRLRDGKWLQPLQFLGIIHIFVLSGAHIATLSQSLKKRLNRKFYAFLIGPLLLFYLLVGKIEGPLLRAWCHFFLRSINQYKKLYWNPYQEILLSLIFTLACRPDLLDSYSLILSWLACLAIKMGRNLFEKSALCFLFLFPVLGSFSLVSPFSILINCSLGLLIATWIFPLVIFSFAFHPLTFFIDKVWDFLFWMTPFLESSFPWKGFKIPAAPISIYWLYGLALHQFLSFYGRKS